MNFKCLLGNEKSQSERAVFHSSGKGKPIETLNTSVFDMDSRRIGRVE